VSVKKYKPTAIPHFNDAQLAKYGERSEVNIRLSQELRADSRRIREEAKKLRVLAKKLKQS